MKTKILCWVNQGAGTDWQVVMAMTENGHYLASHVSSHELWAKHDIGLTSNWKHDIYSKHCPDGYELEWIDNPESHEGLDAAYKLNQELGALAETEVRA